MKKLGFFLSVVCFAIAQAEDRVVLITGASRGIGLATAELLAENGFTVYGTVRNAVPTTKEDIHFLEVDLGDEKSVNGALDTILASEGRLDVLINNAGYALVGPLETLREEEMYEEMAVNFFAPIRFMQAVLPVMRQQRSGHIINISSINAFATPPFGSMYAASKAALESVSESLCVEVKPYNISVSIVEPGLVQTHFALPMGSKELVDNPYELVITGMQREIAERLSHPEALQPSQTAREVGEFLMYVIQDSNPKLRYQTSEEAKSLISKKLLDLTGEIYLEEVGKFLEKGSE